MAPLTPELERVIDHIPRTIENEFPHVPVPVIERTVEEELREFISSASSRETDMRNALGNRACDLGAVRRPRTALAWTRPQPTASTPQSAPSGGPRDGGRTARVASGRR